MALLTRWRSHRQLRGTVGKATRRSLRNETMNLAVTDSLIAAPERELRGVVGLKHRGRAVDEPQDALPILERLHEDVFRHQRAQWLGEAAVGPPPEIGVEPLQVSGLALQVELLPASEHHVSGSAHLQVTSSCAFGHAGRCFGGRVAFDNSAAVSMLPIPNGWPP